MEGFDSQDLLDFGTLLQAMSNSLKVGVLTIRSDSRAKHLRLDRTKLLCVYTQRPRAPLGRVLYNNRAIEKAPLKAASDEVAAHPDRGPLARLLMERGLVTPDDVRRAHRYQVLEEVLELFYWKNLKFSFAAGATLETLGDPSLVEVGEPVDVESILLQCAKTIDDVAKFDEVTPSMRDVYELQVPSLEDLERLVPDAAQREFLLLVDGVRDMREVLHDMRMNRFDAMEIFYRFRGEGMIRPKNSFELLMLAENRRREFSLEKRARILERVNELGVEGFDVLVPLADAYEEMGARDKAAAALARHARRSIEAGNRDEALRAASRAAKLAPDDADMRALEVQALLAAGRTEQAAAASRTLAELRDRAGDVRGALEALRRAAKLGRADAETWHALASRLERLGRVRRAAACLRRAGDAHREMGHGEAAVEAWRRALEMAAGATTVRLRLAVVLAEGGRADESVRELGDYVTYVVERAPRLDDAGRVRHLVAVEQFLRLATGLESPAAIRLGRAYAHLGERDRAVAVLRAASEAFERAGRHHAAAEALEELVGLAPDDLDLRRHLARAHQALGDVSRANAQFRRIGRGLGDERRWAEARDVYEEMLRVDPGCADAHAGLAQSLLELGERRLASVHYHRAALLHRGRGEVDAAVPFFREAVSKNPGNVELVAEYCELLLASDSRDEALFALSSLVELRMTRDEPAEAAIALTRILAIDPRYPGAKDILQQAARRLSQLAEISEELPPDAVKEVMDRVRSGAK